MRFDISKVKKKKDLAVRAHFEAETGIWGLMRLWYIHIYFFIYCVVPLKRGCKPLMSAKCMKREKVKILNHRWNDVRAFFFVCRSLGLLFTFCICAYKVGIYKIYIAFLIESVFSFYFSFFLDRFLVRKHVFLVSCYKFPPLVIRIAQNQLYNYLNRRLFLDQFDEFWSLSNCRVQNITFFNQTLEKIFSAFIRNIGSKQFQKKRWRCESML